MRQTFRKVWVPALLLAFATIAIPSTAQTRSFQLKLDNLTSGQSFSAPIFVTHDSSEIVWQLGSSASNPFQQLAEQGDSQPLFTDLSLSPGGVGSIVRGAQEIAPLSSATFLINADSAHPLLSSAFSLLFTNDGFSGTEGANFNLFGGQSSGSYLLAAYDAGTEVNNELSLYVTGLGGVFGDPENSVITSPHVGILGIGDVPLSRNFSGAVARLTITQVPEPGAVSFAIAMSVILFAIVVKRRGFGAIVHYNTNSENSMHFTFSLNNAIKSITLLALLAFSSMPAFAQSNPALFLDRPGVYVLNRDIMVAEGDAVTITASGVTLDLNEHTISTKKPGTGSGVLVQNAKGVKIKNGKIGAFHWNVNLNNVQNTRVEDLQIVGDGLAPIGGPVEIGILMVGALGCRISDNTLTSMNLGIFVRGGASTGNRIFNNTITGGSVAANNVLGLCYNPAPGGSPTSPGPVGDLIYNNHIARYLDAVSFTSGAKANIFRENTLAYFNLAFRASTVFGPNDTVAEGNIMTQLPTP